MINCLYKKSFLKDMAKISNPYREKIENLVFEKISGLDDISSIKNIKKIRGYNEYYRIRVGIYRIGCKIESGNIVIFYRVKNRNDIYKIFP
ncbi:type II toxin-antitoxin system RelE/ParE family toxin [bacterium]|nr:type II toxin-antitoxin system RelE/ParE family toxin [bacterium]